MEIKILVKENEKAELDKFIKTCKEHGMQLTREGGGKLPNFSGYYAEFKGARWQKVDTGERQSNIPDVIKSVALPEWLSKERCAVAAGIWKSHEHGDNKRVQAIRQIKEWAADAGYDIGFKKAHELFEQHCL